MAKRSGGVKPPRKILSEIVDVISYERYTIMFFLGIIIILLVIGYGLMAKFLGLDFLDFEDQVLTGEFLINLAISLFVALLLFVALEKSVKHLSPIGAFNELPRELYVEKIKRSNRRSEIRVLDTFSYFLIDDRWRGQFDAAVYQAVSNNARVKVLLLDPLSDAARQRHEELQSIGIDAILSMKKSIAHALTMSRHYQAVTTSRNSFEVRIYDASASISFYSWHDGAFISFFPLGNTSDHSPNLEVPLSTPVVRLADDRFWHLWESGNTKPIQDYLNDNQDLYDEIRQMRDEW